MSDQTLFGLRVRHGERLIWARRDTSGTTFRDDIFPTLCKAYVRLHEQDPQYQKAKDAYVGGSVIDDGCRLTMERKIASLFCTSMLKTKGERARERELDREAYHRAVIRFTTVYLDTHELHALADVTLAMLNAHVIRPSLETSPSADRLFHLTVLKVIGSEPHAHALIRAQWTARPYW